MEFLRFSFKIAFCSFVWLCKIICTIHFLSSTIGKNDFKKKTQLSGKEMKKEK